MGRDHSFPRNAEFWAEPQNMPISAEFLCFHGILQNWLLDIISPRNTWLPLGLWWEKYWKYWAELIWNTAINLVDRLHVSVAATGDKYSIFGQVQRPQKINYYMWKICRGKPQNLANWPAEFGKLYRGKLWSLIMGLKVGGAAGALSCNFLPDIHKFLTAKWVLQSPKDSYCTCRKITRLCTGTAVDLSV